MQVLGFHSTQQRLFPSPHGHTPNPLKKSKGSATRDYRHLMVVDSLFIRICRPPSFREESSCNKNTSVQTVQSSHFFSYHAYGVWLGVWLTSGNKR